MPGIVVNEDNSHFYFSRTTEDMTEAGLDAWIDNYVGTQVRELLVNPNAMRSSVYTKTKQPIWDGFEPALGDDQPFFAGTAPDRVAGFRRWVHNALLLHQRGIDPYRYWIDRSRAAGLSPWITMRMNDVHCVDEPEHFFHDRFWREHPEYRRVDWRYDTWTDRAFDYAHPEVRDYQMAYVRELLERYDMDGLELDWMRFGHQFRPGFEEEGAPLLTEFAAEVRRLTKARERDLGHEIKVGARVPSRPQTAWAMGMDAVEWAHRGLVDVLVITPFFPSIEFDMPIELWKRLLQGTGVALAAGLELHLKPFPAAQLQRNTVETVRGAAISLLDRGADRLYLFNYFDSPGSPEWQEEYRQILNEVGSLETMAGRSRRHLVTYPDTWAPGEPQAIPLPRQCGPGAFAEFRLPTGPAPLSGQAVQVRLGLEDPQAVTEGDLAVRLNGDLCSSAEGDLPTDLEGPTHSFAVPVGVLHRGYNVVEVRNHTQQEVRLTWVEIAVGPAA